MNVNIGLPETQRSSVVIILNRSRIFLVPGRVR